MKKSIITASAAMFIPLFIDYRVIVREDRPRIVKVTKAHWKTDHKVFFKGEWEKFESEFHEK